MRATNIPNDFQIGDFLFIYFYIFVHLHSAIALCNIKIV